MWDPATGGIHKTCHIIWLKRMYFPKISLYPPEDGDNIQVSITVQNSSIEAGEGIPSVDSDIIEVDNTNVETNQDDEIVEPDEDLEGEAQAEEEEETPKDEGPRTGSRRNKKMPDRLIAEMNAAANDYEIRLTHADENCYAAMKELGEFGLIGADIGGGYLNISELNVMKFDEAMTKSDKPNWDKAVLEEHDRFMDHTAFEAINREEIPEGTKVITTTWAMKKKASGTY
jgi:hypothetical protein